MSANAPTEGATTDSVPASSLTGSTETQTAAVETPGAIWERNLADTSPAEAAPASEQAAPAESATPTPEAQPQTEQGDRLDQLDPVNAKAADFQELRSHRKELERKLKLVEPLAQKAQAFGDPAVLDIVAPMFQAFQGDDDPALFQAGASVVQGLHAYEPRIANGLAVGIYELYKDWIQEEALKEQGLTPQDLASFKEWKATGGTAVKTVYAPQGFPVADREGYVILPNGVELNIGKADDPTSGDPTHKAMYELAKDNWETKERERQREADATRQANETLQKRQQAEVSQRQETWSTAEIRAFEEFIAANPVKVEGGDEKDQKDALRLTSGVLRDLIEEDAELQRWQDEGKRLAGLGAAKANSLAMNIRTRTQEHYRNAQKQVTDIFTELTNLRKIVAGGRVQNAPRLPSDAIPAAPDQQTPPPPSQAGGNEYQSIWDRNLAHLPT